MEDLRNVQQGDMVYTLYGWGEVKSVDEDCAYDEFPIVIDVNQEGSITTIWADFNGKTSPLHRHPTVWVNPPAYLNAPPLPFKKGDKVFVRDYDTEVTQWLPRIYSHRDHRGYHYCFADGKTEFTANDENDVTQWKFCKRA